VERTTKQVKVDGKNLAGWRRADLEAAVPAELLLAARRVDPVPSTDPATETGVEDAGEGA
jgi:S-DNA-T family DNA segregation ATPase FtsK/SpoIIIE